MASVDSLEALLQEELKDLYDAEKQITKALPKMIKKATADALRQGLEDHLRQTEQHIERLEQAFEHLGIPARAKKCQGMKNLIAEGDDMIGDADEDATRDAVIIAGAQKVEHYEIASYGTCRTWATQIGHEEVAQLLEETLDEEKEADARLTEVAESLVNSAAADKGGQRGQAGDVRGSSSRAGRQVAADRNRGQSSLRRATRTGGSSRSRR